MTRRIIAITLTGLLITTMPALGQGPAKSPGSPNVHVVAHVPLGGSFTIAGIEVEQDLARPFAYVSRKIGSGVSDPGFDIIHIKTSGDASSRAKRGIGVGAERIFSWRIDRPELHTGLGALEGKYFKTKGRYYYVEVFQFLPSGPDAELGAIVFDVTSLPDTTGIREVGRIMAPNSARAAAGDPATAQRRGSVAATPGGFHNVFPYKHSDGRVLMMANTLTGTDAKIYDMNRFLSGDSANPLVGIVPVPGATGRYHDYYVGYDPATRQDKFYGGVQPGGYFVFDITRPEEPKLLTSVTVGYPAVTSSFGRGHTVTPSPDGRYLVTETEYQYAPLRIFDLKPGLDKTVETITRPIGAWTARWKGLPHNHEVRWPYVFVSAYEDGLQIFNLMDPTNPYTVGYYDTYAGPLQAGIAAAGQNFGTLIAGTGGVLNGAWGVDVRNADGIIVISDEVTGFWALALEGFDHWNGRDWGMPNISSVQDWDRGPVGK